MELPVIFLVDPDITAAEAVVSHLSAQGWWVSVVPDGDAALRAAAAHAPSLVIAHRRAEPFESVIEAFARSGGGPGVILLELDAGRDLQAANGVEERDLVSATLLRQGDGGDGVLQETVGIDPATRRLDDAEAGGDRELPPRDREGL